MTNAANTPDATRTWDREPSALGYMIGAFRASPGWDGARGCPDLRLRWRGYRIEPAIRDELLAGALPSTRDARATRDPGVLDILHPQATGFRLVMALLTHPRWPLPIWNALQVRSRLRLLRSLRPGEPGNLTAAPCGWRVIEKGLEIDVGLAFECAGERCWEGVTTFYYRGRHGDPRSGGDERGAPAASPALPGPVVADGVDPGPAGTERWITPAGERRRYGRLTGDYNGLHLWDAYARRMRFPAAFAHPQRIVAQCLARLDARAAAPAHLDLWIKGPVFYGRPVTMRSSPDPASGRTTFGLRLDGDPRPALLGVLANG